MTDKMPKFFDIRKAKPNDVEVILGLINELAEYEKLSDEVVATEEILQESLFGERKVAECVLGYNEDKPVSFALFFHNFSTFIGRPGIYIEDIYVQPEFRGKGIGRSLFMHIAKIASESNCGRVEWAVLDWNEPAINFYKNLGATPMSDWTIYRLSENDIENIF